MFAYDPTTWMMVFLRISALLMVFPLFSMQNFPVRLRVALGATTAFLVTPLLPPISPAPSTWLGTVWLMAGELGIGLLLGFVARLIFFILEFAGGLISMEMGLNMAQSMNPFSQARSEVPGVLLFYLGAVLFLTLDLHHWLLIAFQRSYQYVPMGGAHLRLPLFQDIVSRTSQVFVIGLLMAAPIVAIAFVINLVFSVIGRAVPQMNIFIESFAFRILAGLIVFGLTVNLMGQHILNYLRRLPEDVLRVAQLLAGP